MYLYILTLLIFLNSLHTDALPRKLNLENASVNLFNSSWVSTVRQHKFFPSSRNSCNGNVGLGSAEKNLGNFHVGVNIQHVHTVYPTFIVAVLATSTSAPSGFISNVKLGRTPDPQHEVVVPARFSTTSKLVQLESNGTHFSGTATVYMPSCGSPVFDNLVKFGEAWNMRLAASIFTDDKLQDFNGSNWRVPSWSQSEQMLDQVLRSRYDPAFYTGLPKEPFEVQKTSFLLWTPYEDKFQWVDSSFSIVGTDQLLISMQKLKAKYTF